MSSIIFQHVLNTLVLGGIYAALAAGLTLIFGAMRLIQFAHGEVCMIGAFAALAVFDVWGVLFGGGLVGVMLFAGILGAVFVSGALGWVLERWAFRPLQTRSPILTLVVSLGLAMILRESLAILWPNGRNPQPFLSTLTESVFSVAGVTVSPIPVVLAIMGFVIVLMADRFMRGTDTGLATRAIAQDREAAFMVGIPVSKIQSRTFVLSSIFAGLAGVMVGLAYGSIRYDLGLTLVLKAFTASVIGGMNSIAGAALGALGLATIETLAVAFLPNGSTYRDTITFAVLTLVLIFRPEGLALLREE